MTDVIDPHPSGQLVSDALREGMRAAYEAGYAAGLERGRGEAWDEIHTRIRTAFDEAVANTGQPIKEPRTPIEAKPTIATPDRTSQEHDTNDTGRATRGAVRNAVRSALEKGSTTIRRISSETGYKENSVRSILYIMRGTGHVVRDDKGIWTLTHVGDQESGGGDPEADTTEVDELPETDDSSAEEEGGLPEGDLGEDAKDGEGPVSRADE